MSLKIHLGQNWKCSEESFGTKAKVTYLVLEVVTTPLFLAHLCSFKLKSNSVRVHCKTCRAKSTCSVWGNFEVAEL